MTSRFIYFATALLAFSVGAHASEADQIHASRAWIRLLPGDLPSAGYANLQNNGKSTATLVGASSVDYAQVMLHQSTMASGESHMSMVGQLAIPAGQNVSLAPAGYHLMLLHSKRALKPGDTVSMQFRFTDGSVLSTAFVVKPANTPGD